MNNLSSYCGLVDVKIRDSDKDLPVTTNKDKVSNRTMKSTGKFDSKIVQSL